MITKIIATGLITVLIVAVISCSHLIGLYFEMKDNTIDNEEE